MSEFTVVKRYLKSCSTIVSAATAQEAIKEAEKLDQYIDNETEIHDSFVINDQPDC